MMKMNRRALMKIISQSVWCLRSHCSLAQNFISLLWCHRMEISEANHHHHHQICPVAASLLVSFSFLSFTFSSDSLRMKIIYEMIHCGGRQAAPSRLSSPFAFVLWKGGVLRVKSMLMLHSSNYATFFLSASHCVVWLKSFESSPFCHCAKLRWSLRVNNREFGSKNFPSNNGKSENHDHLKC